MAVPDAVTHPLGPPSVSGSNITVDLMLNQPKRVNRYLMDMSQQRFIMDLFFKSVDGGDAGAIVYDQQTTNELYPTRDVQRIAPGASYPNVMGEETTPGVATQEKWGGKFPVTDEARRRNRLASLQNRITKLANGLVRKWNQRAVAELSASVTATSQFFTGHSWSSIVTRGSSATTDSLWPHADIVEAQRLADVAELGVNLDTLAVNPSQAASLRIAYGAGGLKDMLGDMGITTFMSSNRVPAGKAYIGEGGMVGEVGVEQPLTTKTYRDEDHDRDFVKSSFIAVPYVTNPYAVYEIRGIA